MAVQLILKNSSVEDRRPTPAQLTTGELALNYNEEGAFLSCKDSAGNIQQVGGLKVDETAPSTPVKQTVWLKPSTGTLSIYSGSSWVIVGEVTSVNGQTGAVVLTSADLGLANVNNTSDLNKPISTATQSALSTKADLVGGKVPTSQLPSAELLENAGTGSAAVPSFSFNGDNNTGIYRPAADQVALTAGGTQALLAESTGITIPGNLTVSGTTTTVDTVNLSIKDKNIELGVVSTPSDTTADGGGITLKGATDKTIDWVNSTGCWTFNQPTNFNDHVRIDSSGDVFIGGTSAANAEIALNANGSITAAGDLTIGDKIIHNGDTNTAVRFPANDTVSIETAGIQRLQIDSAGKLLVGENFALQNKTAEDADNGRESIISFEGTQSNNAVSTLSSVEGNHSGQLNDTKGKLVFKTNNGSTLTTALTIDDQQHADFNFDSNVSIKLSGDSAQGNPPAIIDLTAPTGLGSVATQQIVANFNTLRFKVTSGGASATEVLKLANTHSTFSSSVSGLMRYETAVTVTSGSLVEFDNLPSWAKRITVVGYSISFSGSTSVLALRVKSGGSAVTSNYRCTSSTSFGDGTTTTVGAVKYVNAVGFTFGTASSERQLEIVFTNVTGNRWIYAGIHGGIFNSGLYFGNTTAAGDIDAGGALNGIQIFPSVSPDTFTGGTITVICEG